MPSPVSANTNATVYAIAERAAELIRPLSQPAGRARLDHPATRQDAAVAAWPAVALVGSDELLMMVSWSATSAAFA
jgi:hypothetical protein